MKKEIKVVIGANFGDEGKGLMTDYFCHKMASNSRHDILNVRHNGGAQAGHNVVTPDGKQHVFRHFGAGSFVPGVVTYLSEDFIVNPIIFCQELEELKKIGVKPRILVNRNCRVTTPYDMMLNQILERHRGDERHGSCGLGINETVLRYESEFSRHRWNVRFKDLNQLDSYFLKSLRRYYVSDRLFKLIELECLSREELDILNDESIIEHYFEQVGRMAYYCTIVDSSMIRNYDKIVFEGAQGLLLDTDYFIFEPHLTSSKTGSYNPKKILLENGMQDEDIEFCYVARSYFTRHGNGPFPTECKKEELFGKSIEEKHNKENEFQGKFRYGYFDTELYGSAVLSDLYWSSYAFLKAKGSVAFTHLDETEGAVIAKDKKIEPRQFLFYNYSSYGETRNDVKEET